MGIEEDIMVEDLLDEDYMFDKIDCTKCRSQIEQETQQKCWEDLQKYRGFSSGEICLRPEDEEKLEQK